MKKTRNPSILLHKDQIYSLKELPREALGLSEIEEEIINSRISSDTPVSEEKDSFGDALLLKASAIHGINPPASASFSEIVAQEIESMILNSEFSKLGYSEILLAIEVNGLNNFRIPPEYEYEKVKFYGSFVGAEFLSSVIFSYLTLRDGLDKKLRLFIGRN